MIRNILILCITLVTLPLCAQTKNQEVKAVEGFGKTHPIENPEYQTNIDEIYKVVFDVSKAPEDPAQRNKWIETVARFINMHLDAGKPAGTLQAVLVLHGNASYGLLKNVHYKEKYGVDNPNIGLLEALESSGVPIYLCGQTSVARNLSEDRRIPQATLALSAMTVLLQLQNEGYHLINF